ncbi:MAG TPA: TolC family protein [Acidobacteriota bacterium]|nr:TolC family protein [Acidobacteriota bacterium]
MIIFLTFLVLGTAATALGQDSLSLEAAVDEALRLHPALQEARSLGDAAEARVEQARASRLPGLFFEETFTHSNNPVFAFGKKLEQADFSQNDFALDALNSPGALSNFRSSLELRLPVFTRWRIESGIAQAEEGLAVAEAGREWATQQVRFQVIRRYYRVLLAQAELEVAEQALQTAQGEVSRTRDRFEQGLVVASDLMAMEVQAAEFEQQRIQARGGVETARAALNLALGRPLGERPALSGSLQDRDFQAGSLQELIAAALSRRGDVRAAEGQIEISRQDIRKARGDYLPEVGLFAEFGQSSRDLSSGSSDFAVGARLTFDLLDFGRSARISEASAHREAARARRQALHDQVSLAVVRALQDFQSARQRLEVASQAVQQAEETLRIVQDRHQVGLTDVTETLRSQTALVRARSNQLGARYALYLGYARLLLESGGLHDTAVFE